MKDYRKLTLVRLRRAGLSGTKPERAAYLGQHGTRAQ